MTMDEATLREAFRVHTDGPATFTRRMAIILADMDGSSPRQLVLRCEGLKLLKPGSWDWFVQNGGISADQVRQVRGEATQAA